MKKVEAHRGTFFQEVHFYVYGVHEPFTKELFVRGAGSVLVRVPMLGV